MTLLHLLRHGETEENLSHILQGTLPGHLTDRGRRQAIEAAQALAARPLATIVSSDLQRCRDTAAIVQGELAQITHSAPPPALFTTLLRERDWGTATGKVVDGTHRVAIPPDAESVEHLRLRARTFLQFARENYPDREILVISHGLFLRFLQAAHRHVDISQVERMGNCEIRLLQTEEAG